MNSKNIYTPDLKTLTLHLTYQWYDMIESGEKKEEYRNINRYWERRLYCRGCTIFRPYTHVVLYKAYTSTFMKFKIASFTTGHGKPEWGAPENRTVFIIKLGDRIE